MTGIWHSLTPPASKKRRQDPAIQALRGVAVILLVAFHVIGSSQRGLRLADGSMWQDSSLALEDIRMPLFTLISGYVYAMVPVAQWKDYPQLIKGKSRRLLLPLITVGTLLYVLGRTVPGSNFDARHLAVWRIYVFGFEHLWFLQAIFLIFLVVGIMDATGVLLSRTAWFAIVALAVIAAVIISVPPEWDIFSIEGGVRLLPFFLLGYGLRRYELSGLRGAPAVAVSCVFVVVYGIRLYTLFGHHQPGQYVDRTLAFAVSVLAVVLLYSARSAINTKVLAWIGGFSFGIYLLHVFATAATRIFLERIGVHHTWELFVSGLLMGIAAPIAFQLAFRNVGFVRTFILGERGFAGPTSQRRPRLRGAGTERPRQTLA